MSKDLLVRILAVSEPTDESSEQRFKRIYGRDIDTPAEQEVLNEGNANCRHSSVLYLDNAFDGQVWWCDIPNCERHESMQYSPGFKMKFPANALIRTPNPEYGGEDFYAFMANSEGNAELLDRNKWVKREKQLKITSRNSSEQP